MIEGILIGLSTALTLQNIFMVMIGCFFGTIIGMLPGLGPMTAIALMIPITYGFDPATGLILMAGVYYGAVFGGSTSSILLNAPGVPGTVATSFDGYLLRSDQQVIVSRKSKIRFTVEQRRRVHRSSFVQRGSTPAE